MCLIWCLILNKDQRYVGVTQFVFHVLQLLPIILTQQQQKSLLHWQINYEAITCIYWI